MLEIEVRRAVPPHDTGPSRFRFPDPRRADSDGLVAFGGDFHPATILDAYRQGIFPWPHSGEDYLWWSPDPRATLRPGEVHVPRRLARTIRRGPFHVSLNGAFEKVVAGCGRREEGTWISPRLAAAFLRLHTLGWAHSIEVWTEDGELAGGLYGLAIGGLFAAESMFHRVTDASSVALVALAQRCGAAGVRLIDAQMLTPHLARFGFREMARSDYVSELREIVHLPVAFAAAD